MGRMRAALAPIVVAAALASCSSAPSSQPAVGNGPISFSRFEPGTAHIFLVNPAGGTPTQLTTGNGFQAHSAWSPNGRQAVFDQITNTGASIMRINADGTGITVLNKGTPWSTVPSWSPDGSRVAFTSDADGNDEIYTMAADGTDVKQITFTDPPTLHSGPKYSPDGKKILFAMKRPEDVAAKTQDLWIMNVDGSAQTQLTFGYNNNESRTWSPDGQRIAFSAVIDGTNQIFVMNSDGTGIQQVTHNPGTTPPYSAGGIFPTVRGDVTPAWSPDGSRLAFASDRDGNFEIYTMNPDGSQVVRLTNSPDQEGSVGWSPGPTSTR